MTMEGRFHEIDTLLEWAHELSYSVNKFITYAQHVLNEQRKWEPFYINWYKWAAHASLVRFHLETDSPTDCTIDVDKVLDLLCELLWSDIFETDKNRYTQVYDIYSKLIPYWDKVYRQNHKIARKRAIQVLSWNIIDDIPKDIKKAKTVTCIEVDEALRLFDNFCSLLQEVSQNPNIIYISWYQNSIKPQYTQSIQQLVQFIEWWKKSEIRTQSERNIKWIVTSDRITEIDLWDWYEKILEKEIEHILLEFWMFLFKKWELESLPQRNEIIWDLLNLARKISKNRHVELLQLIHLEQYNKS